MVFLDDPGRLSLLPDIHLKCPSSPCRVLVSFVGFTGDLGSFLCSKTPQPETQDSSQTPSQSSDLCTAPVAAANWGPCLRRNVVSERERRCGQSQGGQYASRVETFRAVV